MAHTNSETQVSKLPQSFPAINTTCEAIQGQFPTRKHALTIISIAHEGSMTVQMTGKNVRNAFRFTPLCIPFKLKLGFSGEIINKLFEIQSMLLNFDDTLMAFL